MNARRQGSSRDGERGSASLWVVAFAMVLWLVAAAAVVAGGAMAARHRAATAADLSALAGAAALSKSTGGASSSPSPALGESACATANSVAVVNGARMVSCTVEGSAMVVVTAVAVGGLMRVALPGGEISARAKAGPG